MTAEEIFTRAIDNIFEIMAQGAVYTSSGGSTDITVVLTDMDPSIMDVAPPGDSMVLHVKYSDVANPQRGDTFTISGETWYLVKNLGGGSHEGAWRLEVTRSDRRQI